ncbi:MAG: ABC transporter ATP-binding protein [Oscillospiraceae bacterium]|nr:ABC transporter ATP-binding protein [Oscillospiraceae bacterium]
MNNILEIQGLKKRFRNCEALGGVEMSIPIGQIAGLLGPNASGKTTLLKTIAGLLTPTAGHIRYWENAPVGLNARKTISFCPDVMSFPKWMRVRDAFNYYRDFYEDWSHERALKLIELLELANLQDTRIKRLSKGMKERLVLGLTFSRQTRLYLLDEPMDGIDPVGKARVIDAIISMQPEDASTLISTHMVRDIERIFDSVFFLSKGRVIFSGDCDEMREESGRTVEQKYLEVFIHEGSV